ACAAGDGVGGVPISSGAGVAVVAGGGGHHIVGGGGEGVLVGIGDGVGDGGGIGAAVAVTDGVGKAVGGGLPRTDGHAGCLIGQGVGAIIEGHIPIGAGGIDGDNIKRIAGIGVGVIAKGGGM